MGNDISIFRAGAALGSGVVSATVGAVGIGGASLIRTPEAVGKAYKALWNTKYIGPNLKTMLGIGGLPIAAVLADVAAPIAGMGYGLWRGFAGTFKHDKVGAGEAFVRGIEDTAKDVGTYFEKAPEYLQDAYASVTKPLPEGQEPFDVKIFEAVKGLATGIATAPVMALGIGALTLYRTPSLVGRGLETIWEESGRPVTNLTLSGALLLATPIVDVLAPVAGLLFGFGDGIHKGYTKGTKAAFENVWENLKRYNRMTRDALRD
jgi:hypothetical protein